MPHGDLTPAGVGMDSKGFLCLKDFSKHKILKKSTDGIIIGTPEYMAPEKIYPKFRHNGMTGLEADWYSFGCIL